MTPLQLMTCRNAPLRLVIFDCDGVLVDSEPVSNRLLAEHLTRAGWPISAQESTDRFTGTALPYIRATAEAKLGHALPTGWEAELTRHIAEVMWQEAVPIPGSIEALHALSALGLPWRVGSNSSHAEMRAKFGRVGIGDLVEGRLHSVEDVPHGKPAPDLFLAAAAAEGVAPAECVVVEDSRAGAEAARAAGMDCLGYAPHSNGATLRSVGAVPFHSMFDLPALLRAAWREAA
jgi:HAD superfamily hydrolase (TIGR01509 family)